MRKSGDPQLGLGPSWGSPPRAQNRKRTARETASWYTKRDVLRCSIEQEIGFQSGLPSMSDHTAFATGAVTSMVIHDLQGRQGVGGGDLTGKE